MMPLEIHLDQFSLSNLIHLLVILLFFSDLTLGYRHVYLHAVPSHLSCPSRPQHSSPDGFTSALPIISASIAATTPTGHLAPSMNQYRGEVQAIFLVQQCLNPTGCVWPLQTDLSCPSAVSTSWHNGFHTVFFHLWCFPTAWLNKAHCFSHTSLHTEHNILWCRTSLWPVWVSCPGCTPSELLVHLLTSKAWETGKPLNWNMHY